jgi:hypothetical protein
VTVVAEEGLLDKAIGLFPGVSKRRPAKRPADAKRQLALLQKNLAKLARDVEKLGELITRGKGKAAARGRTNPAGKKTGGRRAAATARKRSRS